MSENIEFSASEIRQILQAFYPHRRLVLSQFTFFNQIGVARPTGNSYRRGRRCYRLQDLLSIACVLALKEEGIPLKNIDRVPPLVQEHADRIFNIGSGCRLSGFGDEICLTFPGEPAIVQPFEDFIANDNAPLLFWAFDVGMLSQQLTAVAAQYQAGQLQRAA